MFNRVNPTTTRIGAHPLIDKEKMKVVGYWGIKRIPINLPFHTTMTSNDC
jgi:hypothetical protein